MSYYPRHHDDEWADEVRIITVPRYKQSEMSGDEWRTSAVVRVLRKNIVMRERSFHSIRDALLYLGSVVGFAPADYDADEPGTHSDLTDGLCMQPGCPNEATVEMVKVKQACDYGHVTPHPYREAHVRWCERHTERGDSSLDDSDDNYEVIDAG